MCCTSLLKTSQAGRLWVHNLTSSKSSLSLFWGWILLSSCLPVKAELAPIWGALKAQARKHYRSLWTMKFFKGLVWHTHSQQHSLGIFILLKTSFFMLAVCRMWKYPAPSTRYEIGKDASWCPIHHPGSFSLVDDAVNTPLAQWQRNSQI